ncbi:STAS domain-containing protein [Chloroflexus sp.]|uniref:STAS domain-containing protein n=1 Tax=Chloroflexus sp. TaxID=1904827 RepID=UPI00261C258E|nr:STAS domain-containing protein [uncultured Chloroflexus sp.]
MESVQPTVQIAPASDQVIAQWRLQILNNLSWVLVALGGLALVAGSWSDYNVMGEQALPYIGVYTLTYAMIVAVALMRQLNLTVRALLLITILGAIATFLLVFFGLIGSGRLIWIGVCLLALIYFGRWGALTTLILSLIAMLSTAALYITSNASFVSPAILVSQSTIADWTSAISLYLASTALALAPSLYLLQRLEGLAHQATSEAARARMHARSAEEHAAQLEQQATQLQATEQMLRTLVQSLETPTVEIAADVLLAPIVGQIDNQRAATLTDRLLKTVSARRARVVVIDVAGVPAFDTAAARHLLQTAQALRLIGCETVITGISPTMAQTITALGVDMTTITTARSPQDALMRLMK